MKLIVLKDKYSIYRFPNESVLPDWIYSSDFCSITKTSEELSVVTAQTEDDPDITISSKDWRILKIIGPLELSLVGVIAEISAILKAANISIFTISTYDTDYILLKQFDFESGITALKGNGHIIVYEE